jgi:predicted DsbA family dithiol-disulfide isomerase
MFAEAGLPFAPERTRVPSSRKALQLSELAREHGLYDALHPRLFDAYWHRDLDIGDPGVLIDEARAAGLDPGEAAETVAGDRYLDEIQRQTQQAIAVGAGGVPAWVVDDRLLIPGAQPHDLFEQVLERLGHEPLNPDT